MTNISSPKEIITSVFGWKSAFIGGTSAIGIGSITGTLSSNLILNYFLLKGYPLEQAYVQLNSTYYSAFLLVLSGLFDISAGLIGGYVSAKFGSGRHLLQGFAAGTIWLMFMFTMFLSPQSNFGSFGYMVASSAIPILSSTLGGYVYAKRA
jgi:hypothetical protein